MGPVRDGARVLIRRERPDDLQAIRSVTAAAFRTAAHSAPPVEPGGDPGEATLVSWLRDPAYYGRFGFVPASSLGITAPDPAWGDYFQARTLTAYDGQRGPFRYAAPFDRF